MIKNLSTLSLALLLLACAAEEPAAPESPIRRIQVQAIALQPQAVVGHIKSLGVLESAEAVTVNVEFSAPVARLHVREGQRVERGQLMLTFDTGKLELQREQTQQNIAQARTQLQSEQANLQRLKVLASKQSISQQAVDNAQFAFQGAQAKVSQLKAQLKLIDKDIAGARVLSPINAVVGDRLVEQGESTSPMQPLFSLEADNSMKFVCFVSESVLPFLEDGLPAKVVTVTGEFESSIYSISAKADPHTGNFEIKILLDNALGQLRPGMTGDIELTTLPVKDQLIIPESALGAFNGEHVVYVIEDGIARRQQVAVRLGFDDKLFVGSGLAFGQLIATEHVNLLTDGSEVE